VLPMLLDSLRQAPYPARVVAANSNGGGNRGRIGADELHVR
jgi:hypothetical protein